MNNILWCKLVTSGEKWKIINMVKFVKKVIGFVFFYHLFSLDCSFCLNWIDHFSSNCNLSFRQNVIICFYWFLFIWLFSQNLNEMTFVCFFFISFHCIWWKRNKMRTVERFMQCHIEFDCITVLILCHLIVDENDSLIIEGTYKWEVCCMFPKKYQS